MVKRIDCKNLYYRHLNKIIQDEAESGETEFILDNLNGQRYLGTGINKAVNITVNGTPGSDCAVFMNGPTLTINGNAQDMIANTMNMGKITVHGNVGDVVGYGMRGGKLFIKGDVGYRAGIHMKEYKSQIPVIISGGTARDFLGEYMAGGIFILLGIGSDSEIITGDYLGTGMHGGVIYIRGDVENDTLGKEVKKLDIDEEDRRILRQYLTEYSQDFGFDVDEIMSKSFIKLLPLSSRPYENLYVY
ncbi:hypothetical protein [Methanohalobium sp.]|uniref:GltB/FmdC/FwdC-like GXGXG domain-containing protein n=1 Tax=Methanohalobium sp. TaxID=2837493 RepID=UPI0025FDB758|nr:hypothetical protein [Methanohalobium sp.]